MNNLRPKTNTYLERPHLLAMLPDVAGYVVWFEAGYGYGKSVLAAQWAQVLEQNGWRVLWLSLQGRDPKAALTALLKLPAYAPWSVVTDSLWQEETLLVLEDFEGSEDINPLLKDIRGLLLLSSRKLLNFHELLRLRTQSRLIHLDPSVFPFSLHEAEQLFEDHSVAKQAWQRTQGWALPLHFTALTGDIPDSKALLEGLRNSLSANLWAEALFLAALPYLPNHALNPHSHTLLELGFAQELMSGIRLHPLVADMLLKYHLEDIRKVVKQHLPRLPVLLQGATFEKLGLGQELASLLESAEGLSHQDPGAVLRWDALAGKPRGTRRAVQVGWSYWTLGQKGQGIQILLEASERSMSATERLDIYKQMIWILAQEGDFRQALDIGKLGSRYLSAAEPEMAGRFMHNLYVVYFNQGDWNTAALTLQQALALYPTESRYRIISEGNLVITEWHRQGDFDGLLAGRKRMLDANLSLNPHNVPGDVLQLAELQALAGNTAGALVLLQDIERYMHINPRWTLEALALKAYLEADDAAFVKLLPQAILWSNELVDRLQFFWARTLRRHDAERALQVLDAAGGVWTSIERALALHSLGRAEALEVLGVPPDVTSFMELRLYWQAARFAITSNPADLEQLLKLTLVKERILPGLLPLTALPRQQPELSRVYPLGAVLESGWKGAINLRFAEIPSLRVKVLGGWSVTVLGHEVALTDRQKELLILLLLGLNREELGDAMWPEADSKKVRNNLNVQLNLLRKTLEPWGISTYLSEDSLKHTEADLWALQQALQQGDAERVLGLYQTPLASGVDLSVLDEAREKLAQDVLELLFDAALEAPDEVAIPCLDRVLELDPMMEEALQELLKRLLKRGRRREAQRRYHKFAVELRSELGLEPLEQTRSLLGL